MSLRRALACATAVEGALAALNLEQSLEEAVLELRQRVYVADSLVAPLPPGTCDSHLDGPRCGHVGFGGAGARAASRGPRGAALADGVLSARLFASADGQWIFDEPLLGTARAAPPAAEGAAGGDLDATAAGGRQGGEATRSGPSRAPLPRARSALLSFRGLEPWQRTLPTDFAGRRGGFPFAVRWIGPWSLSSSPLPSSQVVRRGQFVAQLQGPVGGLRFGRAVHLQAIDLAQPRHGSCQGPPGAARAASGPERPEAPAPLVIRGWRAGREVFTEVISSGELGTFVNGVAFHALTTVELVDEVTLLAADCLMVAAVQASFGDDGPVEGGAEGAPGPFLVTLRDGWRAVGWEEVSLRQLGALPGTPPLWSMAEVVERRLVMRPGVFEEPPRLTEEELDEQDVALPGVGPEPLAMPEGMEEIAEAGPADTGEPIDLAMTRQRNATVLAELARVLQAGAAAPAGEAAAKLLAGLSRRALNEELLRLLRVLTQAAEGASELVVGASTADQAFDRAWRRAGLHSWDTLLVRWHTATTAGVHEDTADAAGVAEEGGAVEDGSVSEGPEAETALLELLVAYLQRAHEVLRFRVRAKNQKMADFARARSSSVGGAFQGEPAAASFDIRMEPSAAGDAVSIVLSDGHGFEAASQIKMGPRDVEVLLEALDPRAGEGGASLEDLAEPGEGDEEDAEGAVQTQEERLKEARDFLMSLQVR